MSKEIEKACVFPPFSLIENFADDVLINRGESLALSSLLKQFAVLAKIGGNYFLKEIDTACKVADAIENVQNLTLS